jgi:CRP-like cAMP-binding protein
MSQVITDFSLLTRASAEARIVHAGEAVFKEGETGSEMYVVRSGAIDIRRGNRTLETVEAGGIFGEMALVDGAPRSADAVAHTDAEIYPISSRQFEFMVSEAPYFATSVMAVMARRLRHANTDVDT